MVRYPLVTMISRTDKVEEEFITEGYRDLARLQKTMLRCNGHNYMVIHDTMDTSFVPVSYWKATIWRWTQNGWIAVFNTSNDSFYFKDMSSVYGTIECTENGKYDINGRL